MSNQDKRTLIPVNIAVLTASDTRTEAEDKSGKALAKKLTEAGHHLADKQVVKDDIHQIRATVCQWIADPDIQVIITTGGTGVSGRDGTPEAIEPLLDKKLDGFGEMFRSLRNSDHGRCFGLPTGIARLPPRVLQDPDTSCALLPNVRTRLRSRPSFRTFPSAQQAPAGERRHRVWGFVQPFPM